MTKKESKSHERYRQKNPTISITLTSDRKRLLDKFKGDLSYAEFIRKLLMEKIDPYKVGRRDGYAAGHEVGSENGGKGEYERGLRDGHQAGRDERLDDCLTILGNYGPIALSKCISGSPDWEDYIDSEWALK